jgi:hypothetical protein
MTIDLYSASHEKMRELMRRASLATAIVDPLDPHVVELAAQRATEMLTALRRRSAQESMLLHPLIGTALPDVRASLDRQHALIEPLIQHIEGLIAALVTSPSPDSASTLQVALDRFISAVLPHMEEEEALAPLLAKVLREEDLAAAVRTLEND